ncbi:hypothetical protein GCM10028895_49790 [Pontibacter rugosus]
MLDQVQIKALIGRLLAFNFSEEAYGLNNFSASDEGLKIGERTIKSVSLVDIDEVNFPSSITPHTEINLGYPLPVDLMHFLHKVPATDCLVYNQVIQIPDQRAEIGKLTAKRKRHTAMPDPANDLAVADIDRVLADIARDNQLLVHSHYNILVSASGQHIDRAVNYIESALFSLGIIPSHNAYNQMELFRCMLPGNASELKAYDTFQTTSDAALCLLFKEGLLKDEESGFQVFLRQAGHSRGHRHQRHAHTDQPHEQPQQVCAGPLRIGQVLLYEPPDTPVRPAGHGRDSSGYGPLLQWSVRLLWR